MVMITNSHPVTTLTAANINRTAISRATGADIAFVSRIFSHKTRPGFDTARRVAQFLNVPISDLCAFLGENPALLPGAPYPYPNDESQLGPIPEHHVSDRIKESHANPCRSCVHRDRYYRGHLIVKVTDLGGVAAGVEPIIKDSIKDGISRKSIRRATEKVAVKPGVKRSHHRTKSDTAIAPSVPAIAPASIVPSQPAKATLQDALASIIHKG